MIWHTHQLDKLDVTVHVETKIKADDPLLAQADFIVLVTGAPPLVPNIKGIKQSNVINVIELAEEQAKDVTIIEMVGKVGDAIRSGFYAGMSI